MADSTEQSRLHEYEKPIGAFCGTILGLFVALVPFIFIDDPSTTLVIVSVVIGAAFGLIVGIKYPSLAHGAFWFLSLLGCG